VLFRSDGTNLVNGYTTAIAGVSGYTPPYQAVTGDTNSTGFGVYGYTSGGVPRIQINRSKSTTKGTNTALASGDNIGILHFGGADGTGFIDSARIGAAVDGAVSTNIVPGRFTINTMNTSGTSVEAARVSSNQFVGINTLATAARRLEVKQDGAPGFRMTNTTGGAGQGIEMLTATTRLSWLLGAQYNVADAFEITPSTAAGGTTFSNPSCVFIPSAVYPGGDNTISSGLSSKRWSVVYAATGTINTSDARAKTAISPLTEAEIKAAIEIANEIGTYQFLDAVESKGESTARLHCGTTVQRVMEIMQANGLDPMRYAFICYDKWDDEYKDFLINEGEKVKKLKSIERQKTVKKLQRFSDVKMIDGVAVLVTNEVETAEGVFVEHPVFDEQGQPVLVDGENGQVQMMYLQPVMETIEIEVEEDAEPKYESRLIRQAGDKFGFRPDELSMFVLRGLAQSLNSF